MITFEIYLAPDNQLQEAMPGISRYFLFCAAVSAVVAFMGFIFMSCNDNTSKQKSSIDIVYNQTMDGSVRQVKMWCQENLGGPESLEFFRWSLVKKTKDGFTVRCKYRSRNSSGEYVLADQIFYMNANGKIIKVLDNK